MRFSGFVFVLLCSMSTMAGADDQVIDKLYEGFELEPLLSEQELGPESEEDETTEEYTPIDYSDVPLWGLLSGSIEGGLVRTTGNTETNTVILKADINNEYESFRNRFVFNTLFKEDKGNEGGSRTTSERYFGSGQINYKMADSNRSRYLYGAYERDRFAGYKSRATISAGWSERYYETSRAYFDLELGPGYKRDELNDSGEVNSMVIARVNSIYERRLTDFSNFKQTFSSDITLSSSDNTASRSESSIISRVFGSLAMKLTVILKHNTRPDEDKKKLDRETTVTLVYAF